MESSIVTMWARRVRLMQPIIEAMVGHPRSGRAGDQGQPPPDLGGALDDRRELELGEGLALRAHAADGQSVLEARAVQGVLEAAPATPPVPAGEALGEGLGDGLGVRVPNSPSTRWRVTVRAPVFGDCSMRS